MKIAFVVFDNEVLALFPHWQYGQGKDMCMSYAHVGQHGGASLDLLKECKPARYKEFSALLKELASIYTDEPLEDYYSGKEFSNLVCKVYLLNGTKPTLRDTITKDQDLNIGLMGRYWDIGRYEWDMHED